MGAYQSSPKVETEPLDTADDRLSCGANAMQGWRMTQEDAHNVILGFDGDRTKALFAVYDGHGGAEVARYCAEKFPDFLRAHAKFKEGDFESCLGPAFLEFDATLVEPEVVEKLKEFAGSGDDEPMKDASKTMFSLLRKRMKSMTKQRGIIEFDPDEDFDSDDEPASDSDEDDEEDESLEAEEVEFEDKEDEEGKESKEEVEDEVKPDDEDVEATISELRDEAQEPLEFVLQKMQFCQRVKKGGRTSIEFISAGSSLEVGSCSAETGPGSSPGRRNKRRGKKEATDIPGIREMSPSKASDETNVPESVVEGKGEKEDGKEHLIKVESVEGNSERVQEPADDASTPVENGDAEGAGKKPVDEEKQNEEGEKKEIKENGLVNGTQSAESTPEKKVKENGGQEKDVVKDERLIELEGKIKPVEALEEVLIVNGGKEAEGNSSWSLDDSAESEEKGLKAKPSTASGKTVRGIPDFECDDDALYKKLLEKDMPEDEDESEDSDDNFVVGELDGDDDDDDDDDEEEEEDVAPEMSSAEESDSDEEAMVVDEDEEDEDVSVEQQSSDDDDTAVGVEEDEEEEDDEEGILCDPDFLRGDSTPGQSSGCTAVVALVTDKTVYVANAGDSRCVLCRKGEAVDLSIDHKPEDAIEFARIRGAGGVVTPDGRVCGGLNLSRSFGDHSYKQNKRLPPESQMITADPDIKTATLGDDDEFLVLACDGIWNSMTSQEVVDFVRQRLRMDPKPDLSEICRQLFFACLAPDTRGDGTGCDNMTAIIVEFRHSKGSAPSSTAPAAAEPQKLVQVEELEEVKTEEAEKEEPEVKATNGDLAKDVNGESADSPVKSTKRPLENEAIEGNEPSDGTVEETAAKRVKLDTAEVAGDI